MRVLGRGSFLALVVFSVSAFGLGRLTTQRDGNDPMMEKLLKRREDYTTEVNRLEGENQACGWEKERRTAIVQELEGQDHFARMQQEVEALRAAEDLAMARLRAKQRQCGAPVKFFGLGALDGLKLSSASPPGSGGNSSSSSPANSGSPVVNFHVAQPTLPPTKMQLHRQNDILAARIEVLSGKLQDCILALQDLEAREKRERVDAAVWDKHLQQQRELSATRVTWIEAEIKGLEKTCKSDGELRDVQEALRDLEAQLNKF